MPAIISNQSGKIKLHLINRLSPGDGLIMTAAIRDLHLTYPDEYEVYVESPFNEIFQNNPYIVKERSPDSTVIEMHYPLIHASGSTGRHFTEGYRDYLETSINRSIKIYSLKPQIFLTQDEKLWPSPVFLEHGYDGPYWLINAGIKTDYTLKQYPYYQEVVNLLKNKIQFVQIGLASHVHKPLDGVLDMVGKTNNLRQLFRLSYHSQGAICPVSLQMVVQACFDKPCVVLNGGREGNRWQAYNEHQFLSVVGSLPCCRVDGCWKSKTTDCLDWIKSENVAHCMKMISPEMVARAVELYYEGGILAHSPKEVLNV